MSCSPEILDFMNTCYRETEDKISFKKDIEGRENKSHFSYTNHLKKKHPDFLYGYKLTKTPFIAPVNKFHFLPNLCVNWTHSMICSYDPKKGNIMYEIDEGGIFHYHTMKISVLDKYISNHQIIIKKI